ncbi:MAG TPA: Ig-like domain-containing protein [Thermoanaerobaculia bacterium]|nr:Ig-like domain-containing protein [Thermoanaerobaculia bacterium]
MSRLSVLTRGLISLLTLCAALQSSADCLTNPQPRPDYFEWKPVPQRLQPLKNDYDPQGKPLTITEVLLPSGGTYQIVDNGTSVLFTPGAGKRGTFTYRVRNSAGLTAVAPVEISEEPVAPPLTTSITYRCINRVCSFAPAPPVSTGIRAYKWVFRNASGVRQSCSRDEWTGVNFVCTFDTAGTMRVDHSVLYYDGTSAILPAGAPNQEIVVRNDNLTQWQATTDGMLATVTITESTDTADTASFTLDWGTPEALPVSFTPNSGMGWQGAKVTYGFKSEGVRTFTLTRRSGGAEDYMSRDVEILNRAPRPSFEVTNPEGDPDVTFRLILDDDVYGAYFSDSVVLDYGDGSNEDFSDKNINNLQAIQHTYPPRRGTYQARLRVTDDFGASGEGTGTISVTNAPPVANFTFSCITSPASESATCTFDASQSFDPDGTIREYRWQIGNRFGTVTSTTTTTPQLVHSIPTADTASYSNEVAVVLTAVDTTNASSPQVVKLVGVRKPAPGQVFYSIEPCRLYDSRSGNSIMSGLLLTIPAGGRCGIPDDAAITAAAINVVGITPPNRGTVHAVYSSPTSRSAEIAAYPAGMNRGAASVAPLLNRALRVYPMSAQSSDTVHLVIDVFGYFRNESGAPQWTSGAAVGPLKFRPARPCVLADSRTEPPAVGSASPRLIGVADRCGLNYDAEAAVLNVTAINPSSNGWITAYPPSMPSTPVATFLNLTTARNLSNTVFARSSGSAVRVATSLSSVEVTVATAGEFARNNGLLYFPVSPCPLYDTSLQYPHAKNPAIHPKVEPASALTVQTRGQCGIPADAEAVVVRLAVGNDGAGFGNVRIYPADADAPSFANINYAAGERVGNTAVLPLTGTSGDLNVLVTMFGATQPVDLSLYAFGYFRR